MTDILSDMPERSDPTDCWLVPLRTAQEYLVKFKRYYQYWIINTCYKLCFYQ